MRSARVAAISCAFLVLLAMGPAFAGGGAPEETQAAVKAAESWLALVDAGEYGRSWEEAAALFREAVTKEQWEASLKALRPALGEVVSRKVESAHYTTSLRGAPDGEYVVIQFATSFTHKKSAVETVTPMKDPDGTWRVSGYYIR
jgi:hypothetical protein